VCRAVGVPHMVLRQWTDRVRAERVKNRCTHFCSDEHAQFVAVAEHLRASTHETYDGIAGDVLSQSSYLNAEIHARFKRRNARGVAEYLLDGYGTSVSDAALERLVAPALFREIPRERAIARLAEEISRHASAPNPTSSFFFWNRTRREVALSPFALMRGLTVYAPYLDRDVVDLLSGLPASLLMDRTLHTEAIARAYPAVAALRYEARTRQARAPGTPPLALKLAGIAASGSAMLRPTRLLPGLVAAAIGGDMARLWHTPLVVYLDQLAKVACDRAT
jgi:asparagine synthase (glutamine-hydrolysing)